MATKATRKKSTAKARQRTTGRQSQRHDEWVNPTSGHGTARDRRTHTQFAADIVTDLEALDLWSSEDIFARIAEVAPREAMRRGYGINAGDKELSETIMTAAEELGINDTIMRAGQMERACGGSAIMPVIDGAMGALDQELDEGSIGKVSALHVLEPRELSPISYYKDLSSPKFGMPMRYRLVPLNSTTNNTQSIVIHESRLVIFPGQRVTRQVNRYQRPGWGHSIYNRPKAVCRDFGIAWSGAAHLLTEFGKGVLKMDGFAELSAQNADSVIDARLRTMAMAASTIKMHVIDKLDEYSRQQTPISGLAELLVQFAQRVAAAADMPLTILMGMSPAGLNATGDMDIRAWYDRIAALQQYYLPRIEKLLRILMLSIEGPTEGIEPEQWSIDFHPLWSPSSMEKAQERKVIAETDIMYVGAGIVDERTVAESRWKGDTYSSEMVIDWAMRDKAEKIAKEAATQFTSEDIAAMTGKPVANDGKSHVATFEDLRAGSEGDAKATDGEGAKLAESDIKPAKPKVVPMPEDTGEDDVEEPVVEKLAKKTASAPSSSPAEARVPLNGAQIGAALEIAQAVVNKLIPRETAMGLLVGGLQFTEADAARIIPPDDFVPAVAPTEAPAAAA